MESLDNGALQEAKDAQKLSMTMDIDKINSSPDLQAFYDDIESKKGANIGDIFTRELSGLGEDEEEAPEEDASETEEQKDSAEEESDEDESEEVEESSEGEDSQAGEDEVEKNAKSTEKTKKSKFDLKKENYERLEELKQKEAMLRDYEARHNELLAQMEDLRLSEQRSWQTAVSHYEHNLKNDIARGEAMLELAIDNFDEKAKFAAYEVIQEAKNKLRSIEGYNAPAAQVEQGYNQQPQYNNNPQYNNPQQSSQYPAPQNQAYDNSLQESVHNWTKKNSIVDPESIYFKPEVREKVISHAANFENDLVQKGQGHLIGSPAYFSAMDGYLKGYIEAEKERARDAAPSKKPSTSHIGSVKGAGAIGTSKAKVDLTSEELSIIRDLPGDQEKIKAEWLKNKINTRNFQIGQNGPSFR